MIRELAQALLDFVSGGDPTCTNLYPIVCSVARFLARYL